MNQNKTDYADTITITCTENNQKLTAELLDYRPAYMLTCSVDRKVKVYLRYNRGNKNYIGNVGTLEFVSDGPEEYTTKQGIKS